MDKMYVQKHNDADASMKFRMKICKRIQQVMDEKKVTQTELARRIGVNRAQISRIVTGKMNFTLETLVRIALALDCRALMTLNWREKQAHQEWYLPSDAEEDSEEELLWAC